MQQAKEDGATVAIYFESRLAKLALKAEELPHIDDEDEAKAVREEVAFFQTIKVILTKRDFSQQKRSDEARELAIRQIIGSAVVSEEVVDVFSAVGLDKPNIGILDDAFLAEVRNLPEKNLAVELLERLLEGEIKTRFAGNVVQGRTFSDLLSDVVKRYQNRAIAERGGELGLTEDEIRFYDALIDNESAVRELSDETLKKIAHELTENLRQNLSVDWIGQSEKVCVPSCV